MTKAESLEIGSRVNIRYAVARRMLTDELMGCVSSSSVCWGFFPPPSHYAFETGLPKVYTIELMQRDLLTSLPFETGLSCMPPSQQLLPLTFPHCYFIIIIIIIIIKNIIISSIT